MSQQQTTVLNPTAHPPTPLAGLGARLTKLEGVRIGLFDNNKPNAVALLNRVGEKLVADYGVDLIYYNKKVPSLEAPTEELDQFATDCDAVVLAIDD